MVLIKDEIFTYLNEFCIKLENEVVTLSRGDSMLLKEKSKKSRAPPLTYDV